MIDQKLIKMSILGENSQRKKRVIKNLKINLIKARSNLKILMRKMNV